jgi:uncharacterized protein YegJ (DUF2314 family)
MIPMRNCLLLVGLLAVLVGCGASDSSTEQTWVKTSAAGNPVVGFSDKDPEYVKAVAEAKKTLPNFIERLGHPRPGEIFIVDAGVPTPTGEPEFIWLNKLSYADHKFTGLLTDEPLHVPGKHKGDKVTVEEGEVDDWAIYRKGIEGSEGSYTAKVLAAKTDEATTSK